MALFVKRETTLLDTEWLGVPMAVRGCHDTAELLAKRTENDGWFRRPLLTREGADEALIAATIEAGLIEAEGDMLRPVGWLDRNPSQEAIGARKATRSDDGRRGNHVRWEHPGRYEDCPKCQVVAGSDRPRSGSDRPSSPESESDLEAGMRSPQPTDDRSHPGFGGPKPVAALAAVKDVLGTRPRRSFGGNRMNDYRPPALGEREAR
jgi:hypothetical protein